MENRIIIQNVGSLFYGWRINEVTTCMTWLSKFNSESFAHFNNFRRRQRIQLSHSLRQPSFQKYGLFAPFFKVCLSRLYYSKKRYTKHENQPKVSRDSLSFTRSFIECKCRGTVHGCLSILGMTACFTVFFSTRKLQSLRNLYAKQPQMMLTQWSRCILGFLSSLFLTTTQKYEKPLRVTYRTRKHDREPTNLHIRQKKNIQLLKSVQNNFICKLFLRCRALNFVNISSVSDRAKIFGLSIPQTSQKGADLVEVD